VSKITFNRDKTDTFRCEVAVQGADKSSSRARLVLEFTNGKTYMFRGTIKGDGTCEIPVPKLQEDDGSGGTATLEIIAESAFFEPWQGGFQLKSSKSVQVEGIQVGVDNSASVTVNNIQGAQEDKDTKIVKSILEGFNPKDKRTRRLLSDYEPTKRVKDWARGHFKENINSPKALYCMMVLEERLRKNKRKK